MKLANLLFLAAAGISFLGALAHELIGAPMVLDPLQDSGLPKDVIWLHHFSWHVGTVSVLAMVAMFILAALRENGLVFGLIATVMSAGFAGLGISLAAFGNAALWQTLAPYPWTVIAVLGGIGIRLSRGANAH